MVQRVFISYSLLFLRCIEMTSEKNLFQLRTACRPKKIEETL